MVVKAGFFIGDFIKSGWFSMGYIYMVDFISGIYLCILNTRLYLNMVYWLYEYLIFWYISGI